MKHPKWTDSDLIRDLRGTEAMRDRAWTHILEQTDWRASVLKYVLKKGGSFEDAREVFQEAMFSFYQSIRSGRFESTSELKTYFIAIAKNKWRRTLRDHDRHHRHEDNLARALDREAHWDGRGAEEAFMSEDRQEYLLKIAALFGERCKQIMQLFSQGFDMEEIAREVGLSGGADAAKREKYRCRQRILRHIADNPKWKNHI